MLRDPETRIDFLGVPPSPNDVNDVSEGPRCESNPGLDLDKLD